MEGWGGGVVVVSCVVLCETRWEVHVTAKNKPQNAEHVSGMLYIPWNHGKSRVNVVRIGIYRQGNTLLFYSCICSSTLCP